MQNPSKLAVALLVGTILSAPATAAEKPFVTVNRAAVSQATAAAFMAQGKARGMPDTPELRNKTKEELIRRELMFQEAKRIGLDKKPEIAAQAEAAKQTVIIRAFVDDFVKKNPLTDVQLRSEYDAMKAKGGDTEYKARHILVKSDEEGKAIIASLNKGDKFEELARQSIDPGSKATGGDLDWSSPAKFVKPFADALVALKKGKYTEAPVKSDFGYHVIKLEDTRPLKVPSFDEMKPMLQQSAQAQTVERMVSGLRAKAKIE
jgi:peptidyl-prolyl cis-trans isomerase C